jgi:hypothetical protein
MTDAKQSEAEVESALELAGGGGGEHQPGTRLETPLPLRRIRGVEERMQQAWCQWLTALASDAEAAMAAAMAYRSLGSTERDTWLAALAQDADKLDVPKIALYAPLLAVESDPERRARMLAAAGGSLADATPRVAAYALRGWGKSGLRIAVLVTPLYLDFVQVLACGYHQKRGFDWVRHDPIVDKLKAPVAGNEIEGLLTEAAPLGSLVDELAHVVLAHQRAGRSLPEALRVLSDIFEPGFGSPSRV